ncbi:FCS-Like Zinc finger 1-like [Populus alba x Populus x berolinensis]|uniref:Senescence-associated family protein n=3 Tax=Populus TaxID=3689 RepID=A0A4U5NRW9_POPAL|nr:FCS-Like Zinc finger 1-like [Populus alba]KAJ6963032.1 FCS-Like Zinc finger 1-like [Populus alba x Populus x berolinensis]KAJ7011280.1 FCS-Like Zinc finger 1-like [Populus alba x Populus x berolinensis]TKR85541.1 senescence-associated family protein [Populus alba]
MEFSSSRRPCFNEEDDGLASLADIEAGSSGNHHPFFSRSLCYARRGSFRNLSSLVSSPRSARYCDSRYEDHLPHFLEACFLCKKPLGDNRDIFMYRGDTPFCSEECRQEQIDIDEANEKNWNLSSSMKALRKKDQKKSKSPTKAQDYPSRTGTVAAA